ncbi:hypothetical protein CIB48_g11494 [Xylaria polymorpha]|nr:hypothetical protein CIB48_g11494 [Xylaria polymorpha]
MDNAKYAAYFTGTLSYIEHFVMAIDDVLEDTQDNKVAVWTHSSASTDVGPWDNEVGVMEYFHPPNT